MLNENIRAIRKSKGLSQEELAINSTNSLKMGKRVISSRF